ncbi:hypothetical protein [Castellaniella sp.]|uniref:hypothetical protein n=1 Tax=Castellaniella sp. TaxID=1955812 RepID=UPI002AFECC31|nr:hypothetical protein [Castellaniella sp.]
MAKKSKKTGTKARFACGKLRPSYRGGETEAQATATARAYRARLVGDANAMRPEAGYSLGRVYLLGQIASPLHEAGLQYAALVEAWQRVQGLPSPFPAAMDLSGVRGLSLYSTPSIRAVERITNDYMKMQTALSDAGRNAIGAVREVCLYDRDWRDIESLRSGLEVLAKFFQVRVDVRACA